MNRVAAALVPSKQKMAGFPRWRWFLAMVTQATLFQALVFMMWRQAMSSATPLSIQGWLSAPASALGVWERCYVLALFASQSRDMFPLPKEVDFMMVLHHWVVMIACVAAFFVPAGFGLFILGTFVLEMGSMTFNMRTLYPDKRVLVPIYQASMFASNIAALACGYYMVSAMDSVPSAMKVIFLVADVGIVIGRQRHALKDLGLLGSRKTHKH
eukprot:gnl/TRDRNA2_/TRDRNA2_89665_c0_seq1.p1 gnl/TRDRNA2_/TRDRNA2_89665_c0~~gnl/TRDRNA2_/TRDRNA2_89665_c0_seq1.p1  ORF type:complete len:250 (-),score=36.94 gnl/TRDRNA2_/TRDRNA2_89665_c0_seq1:123-761(-)